MEPIVEIDKNYLENMPLEKKTEFLFEYKSKSYDNLLDDNFHTLKRNIGVAWFDRMLEGCRKGNCPRYFSDDIFYALTDMSLEGYALQKAYPFIGGEVGINDKENYFKALDKINIKFWFLFTDQNRINFSECFKISFLIINSNPGT